MRTSYLSLWERLRARKRQVVHTTVAAAPVPVRRHVHPAAPSESTFRTGVLQVRISMQVRPWHRIQALRPSLASFLQSCLQPRSPQIFAHRDSTARCLPRQREPTVRVKGSRSERTMRPHIPTLQAGLPVRLKSSVPNPCLPARSGCAGPNPFP